MYDMHEHAWLVWAPKTTPANAWAKLASAEGEKNLLCCFRRHHIQLCKVAILCTELLSLWPDIPRRFLDRIAAMDKCEEEQHPSRNSQEKQPPNVDERTELQLIELKGWRQASEIALVRSASHSLYARLRSIEWDARRVLTLCDEIAPELPVFANARTGTWYVPPSCLLERGHGQKKRLRSYNCCFKSADGHYGQWNASIRRPNLQVLHLACRAGGVFIIDATRSGKTWPDALTKTVPIWCAVVNAVAGLSSGTDHDTELHLHRCVAESEKNTIAKLLPTWIRIWKESSIDLRSLAPGFVNGGLPLRPLWVRADADRLWEQGVPAARDVGFLPIICVSASPPLRAGDRSFIESDANGTFSEFGDVSFHGRDTGFPYVQGAGDDGDNWSHGLTPQLFWHFRNSLINFAESHQAKAASDPGVIQAIDEFVELVQLDNTSAGNERISSLDFSGRNCPCGLYNKKISNVEAPSDARFKPLLGSGLILRSSSPNMIVKEAQMLREACNKLIIVLSRSQEAVAAANLLACAKSSASDECKHERSQCENKSDKGLSRRMHWFNLANRRGKPDHKYGLYRVLGPGLSLIRGELCGDRFGEQTDKPASALVVCDSGDGDWACGLATAWLAWHCDTEGNVMPFEKTCVSKKDVHVAMLRVLAEMPDLSLSRHTLQQINRFFQSPDPPSRV